MYTYTLRLIAASRGDLMMYRIKVLVARCPVLRCFGPDLFDGRVELPTEKSTKYLLTAAPGLVAFGISLSS